MRVMRRDDLGFKATSTGIGTPPSTRLSRIVATLRVVEEATRMWNCWRKRLERNIDGGHRSTSSGPFAASVFLRPVAAPIDGVDGVASPSPRTRRHDATPSPRPREPRHTAGSARRPAKRARVVSQTRRMIGPKNRPASARPDSHLKLNTALHQLHPDFDGTQKIPARLRHHALLSVRKYRWQRRHK